MTQLELKTLLEAAAKHTTDASTKTEVESILKEIGSMGEGEDSNPDQIPKPIQKRALDVMARFFLKLAEYKVIRVLWEAIEAFVRDHHHH